MRIIIKCPESNSPLRGRIHLRGLSFRPTSNLLQFGGGPYIECKRLWLLKYLDYTHHGLRSALKPNGLFTSIMIKCMTHEKRVRQSFSKQAFMSTLGAELKAVVQGGVEIRLPFSPTLTQQNGYLHAGAITAVLDSACGYAALTVAADDKEVLTVEFKVNLLVTRCRRGLRGQSASEESRTDADSLCSGCLCHQRWQREGGCNHAGHNHGCADNPREIARRLLWRNSSSSQLL